MPFCYYTIEKPKADTFVFAGRCGSSNSLKEEDFKMVQPGGVFDPYEISNGYTPFPDFISTQKETYRNPGIYKIQFHYSTNTEKMGWFIGSISMENLARTSDTTVLKELLAKLPKVELESNTIEIKIKE